MFAKPLFFSLFTLSLTQALHLPLLARNEVDRVEIFQSSLLDLHICVTEQNGGSDAIALSICGDGSAQPHQRFSFNEYGKGPIGNGDGECLDSGENVYNGVRFNFVDCEEDKQSQVFRIDEKEGGEFMVKNGNEEKYCLDVEKDSQPGGPNKPYGYQRRLQAWECHEPEHPDIKQQYFRYFVEHDSK